MMQHFWHRLNARERIIVSVGALFVVFMLGYVWGYKPLSVAVEQLREQSLQQQSLLQWLQQAQQRISRLKAAGYSLPQTSSDSLLVTVETSLGLHKLSGFVRQVQQPQDNQVQLQLQQAPFDHFITWLEELSKHTTVKVAKINITPGSITGTANITVFLSQ